MDQRTDCGATAPMFDSTHVGACPTPPRHMYSPFGAVDTHHPLLSSASMVPTEVRQPVQAACGASPYTHVHRTMHDGSAQLACHSEHAHTQRILQPHSEASVRYDALRSPRAASEPSPARAALAGVAWPDPAVARAPSATLPTAQVLQRADEEYPIRHVPLAACVGALSFDDVRCHDYGEASTVHMTGGATAQYGSGTAAISSQPPSRHSEAPHIVGVEYAIPLGLIHRLYVASVLLFTSD